MLADAVLEEVVELQAVSELGGLEEEQGPLVDLLRALRVRLTLTTTLVSKFELTFPRHIPP